MIKIEARLREYAEKMIEMPTILLVDDSPTQIVFAQSVLQEHGISIRSAQHGRDALDVMNTHHVDVVVTDMQMPVMDGLDLIREMQIQHPAIPAILLTGHGSEGLAAEALSAGAVTYLSKEHIHIQLRDTTHRVLQLAHAHTQAMKIKGVLRRSAFEFATDSCIDRITPLVCLQLQMMTTMRLLHTGHRIRIAEALHYLYYHTMLHENLELPISKTPLSFAQAMSHTDSMRHDKDTVHKLQRAISVWIDANDDALTITLAHQGLGGSLKQGPLPGTPDSFSDERARGMLLLTSLMDEVFINRRGEIMLIKRL
ncbi:response regulator [Stieleria varia]|uniref:Transcriptional regulatory protein QseF n=1 Tax=Stieleria varia TaxID=2528005 RepID=A0A5C6B3W0_9BACT|nr:response regulator [Stieleria varia]TWU06009.1 Transcriptional regulatory protein QseF [Stieleria varia]